MASRDQQNQKPNGSKELSATPAVIVSSDAHVGPLAADLRGYCPKRYLQQFDEFVQATQSAQLGEFSFKFGEPEGRSRRERLNAKTEGHHDMHARRRDMDQDGVVAEVIFHGSQNGEHIPFVTSGFIFDATNDLELKAVGYHIYNQWLADACSVAPERSIGLAHVPVWDVEGCVREVEWAREAGLRGVNWPAPRQGVVEYDNEVWEPFWAACASLGLVLNSHSGANVPGMVGPTGRPNVPHGHAILQLEGGGWYARRGLHRMLFAGVFERHPRLKIAYTEQPGIWWSQAMTDMDSAWMCDGEVLHAQMPKMPSDYCRTNIFIGASFMAHFEMEEAISKNYVSNMMWGSDYPHREGTWGFPDGDEPNRTRLALHDAMHDFPIEAVEKVLGKNAIEVFDLDAAKLEELAKKIGAPTYGDLTAPLKPEESEAINKYVDIDLDYTHAFRTFGPWH